MSSAADTKMVGVSLSQETLQFLNVYLDLLHTVYVRDGLHPIPSAVRSVVQLPDGGGDGDLPTTTTTTALSSSSSRRQLGKALSLASQLAEDMLDDNSLRLVQLCKILSNVGTIASNTQQEDDDELMPESASRGENENKSSSNNRTTSSGGGGGQRILDKVGGCRGLFVSPTAAGLYAKAISAHGMLVQLQRCPELLLQSPEVRKGFRTLVWSVGQQQQQTAPSQSAVGNNINTNNHHDEIQSLTTTISNCLDNCKGSKGVQNFANTFQQMADGLSDLIGFLLVSAGNEGGTQLGAEGLPLPDYSSLLSATTKAGLPTTRAIPSSVPPASQHVVTVVVPPPPPPAPKVEEERVATADGDGLDVVEENNLKRETAHRVSANRNSAVAAENKRDLAIDLPMVKGKKSILASTIDGQRRIAQHGATTTENDGDNASALEKGEGHKGSRTLTLADEARPSAIDSASAFLAGDPEEEVSVERDADGERRARNSPQNDAAAAAAEEEEELNQSKGNAFLLLESHDGPNGEFGDPVFGAGGRSNSEVMRSELQGLRLTRSPARSPPHKSEGNQRGKRGRENIDDAPVIEEEQEIAPAVDAGGRATTAKTVKAAAELRNSTNNTKKKTVRKMGYYISSECHLFLPIEFIGFQGRCPMIDQVNENEKRRSSGQNVLNL